MMQSISMKVNPLYSDMDMSIQFHFEFSKGDCKVGEAMVSTYVMNNQVKYRKSQVGTSTSIEKCAVIDRYDVVGELGEVSMKKMRHFLKVIGMAEVHCGYEMNSESVSN
ncbi:hypothetical protein NQ095_19310 [Rossellomorea sp. SC111]|uniref:hypothetical protein n=1 Tax=Rossellomorea sp. SC111 TaxID=2968985 RepID=UPI00215A6DD0|nr:hypothetical protein [Rossellomorea sp. SC111]MCR8850573.1 hypothetical protein [Rossellomorea sp. SC111]